MMLLIERIVKREGDLIYRSGRTGLADALEATEAEGLEPQFAPEVAKYRANNPTNGNLWSSWTFTPSVRATGQTKQGSKVVVYAHIPNYFSKHENLRAAVEGENLRNGAGAMPQAEFQALIDRDGMIDDNDIRRVHVVDYDTLKNASSGVISVGQVLAHPQTIPFIGSEEGAQAYLTAHRKTYSTNYIGVGYSDDFDPETPRARLLLFGDFVNCGLSCVTDLYNGNDFGRVLGVAPEAQGAGGAAAATPNTGSTPFKMGHLENTLYYTLSTQPMSRGVTRTDIRGALQEYRDSFAE